MNFLFKSIIDDINYTAIDIEDMKKVNLLFLIIYIVVSVIISNYYLLMLSVLFYTILYFYVTEEENKSLFFLGEADFLLKLYYIMSCIYIFFLGGYILALLLLIIPIGIYGKIYKKRKFNLIQKYYCGFTFFILKELKGNYERYYEYNFTEFIKKYENEKMCVVSKSDKKILLEAEKSILGFIPLIPYLIYVNIVGVIIILFLKF